jgi:hypothetical protein
VFIVGDIKIWVDWTANPGTVRILDMMTNYGFMLQ